MSKPSRPDLQDASADEDASIDKRKKYNIKYYSENRDKLAQYAKEYRKTEGYKAQITEYKRQYHIENREKINERTRKYYTTNREKKLAYGKKWREENADKMRLYRHRHKTRLRLETFDAYGGPVCKCCGEKELLFLTIDHINNNGSARRKLNNNKGGYAYYRILKKEGYPPGYQVLCFNCNCAKGFNGICPHQMPMTTYAPL